MLENTQLARKLVQGTLQDLDMLEERNNVTATGPSLADPGPPSTPSTTVMSKPVSDHGLRDYSLIRPRRIDDVQQALPSSQSVSNKCHTDIEHFSLRHISLAYHTKEDRYICRMCMYVHHYCCCGSLVLI